LNFSLILVIGIEILNHLIIITTILECCFLKFGIPWIYILTNLNFSSHRMPCSSCGYYVCSTISFIFTMVHHKLLWPKLKILVILLITSRACVIYWVYCYEKIITNIVHQFCEHLTLNKFLFENTCSLSKKVAPSISQP
jgi:hypothetical protein